MGTRHPYVAVGVAGVKHSAAVTPRYATRSARASGARQYAIEAVDVIEPGGAVAEVGEAEVATGAEQKPAEKDKTREGAGGRFGSIFEVDHDRPGAALAEHEIGNAAGVGVRERAGGVNYRELL
jgi:hypothetical protein